MKQGYPLRAVDGFDSKTLATLRDELSVTTAEEFLHAATAYPHQVAKLLETDPSIVSGYAEAAAAALGDEAEEILNPQTVAYNYRTGHDAPAGATFWQQDE
jgi:hypothetical protein